MYRVNIFSLDIHRIGTNVLVDFDKKVPLYKSVFTSNHIVSVFLQKEWIEKLHTNNTYN